MVSCVEKKVSYKLKKCFLYWILFLLTCFFTKILFADSNDEVSLFSADNSAQGVKNNSPVNLSINHDSLLGVVGDITTLLSLNDANATAIELAAGPRVFRGNATYGFAVNDANRIKITAEYLTENLDFNFYSGDTRQWVEQGALGAAYEYWLDGDIFKSLQIGSHYSHAPSKNLSDQSIDLGQGYSLLDERRIAGGDDWNGTAETAMRLWPHSLLTLGADYDRVRYDTHYSIHNDADAQGMGGHIRLQQLLASSTQFELQSIVSQLYNSYGGGLNWIWTSHKGTAWGAGLSSTYTNDHTTERRFWVNGINLSIVWDTPRDELAVANYSDPDVSATNLLTWTSTPAVRMPDVLAISDERITGIDEQRFVSAQAFCPAANTIVYANGAYSAPNGWAQSFLSSGNHTNVPFAFDSANIMSQNGSAECLYNFALGGVFTLVNANYQHVVPVTSNIWLSGGDAFWSQTNQPAPAQYCNNVDPTVCAFATVQPRPATPSNMVKATDNTSSVTASAFRATLSDPLKARYREPLSSSIVKG